MDKVILVTIRRNYPLENRKNMCIILYTVKKAEIRAFFRVCVKNGGKKWIDLRVIHKLSTSYPQNVDNVTSTKKFIHIGGKNRKNVS